MGRGRAPWSGAAARRFRFAPGLLALALTLPTAALAVGCGNSGAERPGSGDTARATASASASASAQGSLSPEELCTSAVGYWAREILAGKTPYGDYQSMGLSNAQYDILREVVDAAQATKRDQGPRAAEKLIDRQVSDSCADQYRAGAPSDGPWQ
ncbi:hypothetical protein RI578_29325 [Streptomyces sp. BB1-1-1]|uniref:hypothetical protein n=1 Tax=Streptomyces sp. BB1-1-1 TaxID=3074430 RepID=UPI002878073B|nr:hypothetical protein [Streptomyces sp. BB1-1-1]WND38131.1 hypothetical protein RI578_29325 [Streptomyces sp. BB1-1-1]